MKRRSGVQMTFRLGQENDTNLFCVNIHCPTIILSGVRFFYNAYAPVICNHCPPTYGDSRGMAGLMSGVITC